ncbi:hypothetical protein GOP47_0016612 [Adiantum capillus-veneris]|uniref:Uncharacterized protein n=1 Tax=Adiantum capillus-veneris TaxID=13818 RepID=A0A9D4UIE3_ADICA|nr:hypothetical protein GOP47_0016612 [Adiantum capillus-veneris]
MTSDIKIIGKVQIVILKVKPRLPGSEPKHVGRISLEGAGLPTEDTWTNGGLRKGHTIFLTRPPRNQFLKRGESFDQRSPIRRQVSTAPLTLTPAPQLALFLFCNARTHSPNKAASQYM